MGQARIDGGEERQVGRVIGLNGGALVGEGGGLGVEVTQAVEGGLQPVGEARGLLAHALLLHRDLGVEHAAVAVPLAMRVEGPIEIGPGEMVLARPKARLASGALEEGGTGDIDIHHGPSPQVETELAGTQRDQLDGGQAERELRECGGLRPDAVAPILRDGRGRVGELPAGARSSEEIAEPPLPGGRGRIGPAAREWNKP